MFLPKTKTSYKPNGVNLWSMKGKQNIIFLVFLLLLSGQVSAQALKQKMSEEPKAGASIFRPYFYDETAASQNPVGGGSYKPFYVSHFGRHGARYYTHQSHWQPAVNGLEAAKNEGLLTAEGEALYSAVKRIYDEHKGMYGELTPLGASEHRQIAARLYRREKSVFSSKSRNQVRCASSIFSRCLMSMANFSEELSSLAPQLEVSYIAGQKYNDEYLNSPLERNFNQEANLILDSLKRADLRPESLLSLYFTSPEVAKSLIPDLYAFEMGLYYFWAISYDLDFLNIEITHLFPFDELARCSAIDNAAKYAKVALSEEFGSITRIKGIKVLKDFMVKADEALQPDSKIAADFRFAHDSAFLPICTLLGVEGYPVCSVKEAYGNWNASEAVPMCANLQMVFYKGKGNVLVKVLVNEKEVALGGLTPAHDLFYNWSDIKSLIEGLDSSCSAQQTNFDMENKSHLNQLYE